MLTRSALLGVSAWLVCSASGCAADEPEIATGDEQNLIGGTSESRFQAVGYLAAEGGSDVLCGATLIAPNVAVTAAHCAYRHRDRVLEVGFGELEERRRVAVRSVHNHPEASLEKQGAIDLVHTLLLFDLAYMLLEEPVEGIVPAALSTTKPRHGDSVQLVAYGPLADDSVRRKGVRGSVVVNLNLAGDSIVEVAPRDGGAVCHRHGDEGHAAVVPDADGNPVLVGIYVGSVTQSFSDCRKYLQYLNGYEASFGHLAFYEEGIAAGEALLSEASCDPGLICTQALSCVGGKLYPTGCGPANCDEPIDDC
jgi:hypothetical protein